MRAGFVPMFSRRLAAEGCDGARGFAEDVLGVILVSVVAVLHAVEPKLIGSIPRERNSYCARVSPGEENAMN